MQLAYPGFEAYLFDGRAVIQVETVHYGSQDRNGHEGYPLSSGNTDDHLNVATTAVAITAAETVYYGSQVRMCFRERF